MRCLPCSGSSSVSPLQRAHSTPLSLAQLALITTSDGAVDDGALRTAAFYGGVAAEARLLAWPRLLGVYPAGASTAECAAVLAAKTAEYGAAVARSQVLQGSEGDDAWRNQATVIGHDVNRTEASHAAHAELKPRFSELLLAYAALDGPPDAAGGPGYGQGMSDLLSVLLFGLPADTPAALVFACFAAMMGGPHAGVQPGELRHFYTAGTVETAMVSCLGRLLETLRVCVPKLHAHISSVEQAQQMLFCYRWVLLLLKREFAYGEVPRLWEACWGSKGATGRDDFVLFVAAAILQKAEKPLRKQNGFDVMLKFCNELSGSMEVDEAIAAAERLARRQTEAEAKAAAAAAKAGGGAADGGAAGSVAAPVAAWGEGSDEAAVVDVEVPTPHPSPKRISTADSEPVVAP